MHERGSANTACRPAWLREPLRLTSCRYHRLGDAPDPVPPASKQRLDAWSELLDLDHEALERRVTRHARAV